MKTKDQLLIKIKEIETEIKELNVQIYAKKKLIEEVGSELSLVVCPYRVGQILQREVTPVNKRTGKEGEKFIRRIRIKEISFVKEEPYYKVKSTRFEGNEEGKRLRVLRSDKKWEVVEG